MIEQKHLDNLNQVFQHRKYLDCQDQILEHIERAPEECLLYALGLSGVGKSTVVDKSAEHLSSVADRGESNKFDTGPIIVRAPAPGGRAFEWKLLYKKILLQLGEFGVEHKYVPASGGSHASSKSVQAAWGRLSRGDLEIMLEQALRDTRPAALFIDECQHIGASRMARVKSDNLDVIKNLRGTIPTPIVLVGTYEAQTMLAHSQQMIRRSEKIFYDPYYPTAQDREDFGEIFDHIVEHAQLPLSFSIENNLDELLHYSVGFVGHVVEWLKQALSHAKARHAKALNLKDLRATRRWHWEVKNAAQDMVSFDEAYRPSGALHPWARTAGLSGTARRAEQAAEHHGKPGQPYPRNRPDAT